MPFTNYHFKWVLRSHSYTHTHAHIRARVPGTRRVVLWVSYCPLAGSVFISADNRLRLSLSALLYTSGYLIRALLYTSGYLIRTLITRACGGARSLNPLTIGTIVWCGTGDRCGLSRCRSDSYVTLRGPTTVILDGLTRWSDTIVRYIVSAVNRNTINSRAEAYKYN